MKILIAVDAHYKEYGGPYRAISQKIEYLNKNKIDNKLIFNRSNVFKFNLDLDYIIRDYEIVHIYGYDSLDDRAKRRKELAENDTWKNYISKAIGYVEHQESKILIPASFSKIK